MQQGSNLIVEIIPRINYCPQLRRTSSLFQSNFAVINVNKGRKVNQWIVDSADVGRLEEAKISFDSVCDHGGLRNVPVITIANKQDLPGALTPGDLAMNFYVVQDAADRTRVFAVNAISGQGIEECILEVVSEALIHARSRTSSWGISCYKIFIK